MWIILDFIKGPHALNKNPWIKENKKKQNENKSFSRTKNVTFLWSQSRVAKLEPFDRPSGKTKG